MSSPLITQEVRWFLDGDPPQPVKRWFFKDCPGDWLSFADSRTDVYLIFPESEAINIKQRNGHSLELKWRESILGVWQIGDHSGQVERWRKWIEDGSFSPESLQQFSEDWWVEAHKTRWQRQYRGVRYELTQLQSDRRTSWSLAYELESSPPNYSHLAAVVCDTLKSYPDNHLCQSSSYSYTHWLIH
ncbi:hypothetical protein [Baaleninema sp.]|uniref:hypothetical protein n=1 Tax=Baaleninema sp. TaxID=3101197 RepID=UPI003D06817D